MPKTLFEQKVDDDFTVRVRQDGIVVYPTIVVNDIPWNFDFVTFSDFVKACQVALKIFAHDHLAPVDNV